MYRACSSVHFIPVVGQDTMKYPVEILDWILELQPQVQVCKLWYQLKIPGAQFL